MISLQRREAIYMMHPTLYKRTSAGLFLYMYEDFFEVKMF
jgi:hypothetical protein